MKVFKKTACLMMALVMALCCFTGCGKKANKTLVMATNATFPPYEYKEGDNFEGIDVEIAQEIAKKMNRTLQIEDVDFGAIIGGVQSGKYDIGMAGMTVTDERKKA